MRTSLRIASRRHRVAEDPTVWRHSGSRISAWPKRRRRLGVMQGSRRKVKPTWRPFQLAFILMNLKASPRPLDDDRKVVDLLFFPTGGGKTEAYLGLAAFTLVLRRLRNPGIQVGWPQRADALHAPPAYAGSTWDALRR